MKQKQQAVPTHKRQIKMLMALIIHTGAVLYFLSRITLFSYCAFAQDNAGQGAPFHGDLQSSADKAELSKEYIDRASSYYKNGRYNEAIEFWNNALAIDPSNGDAAKGLAEARNKISKINVFFGKDVYEVPEDVNELSLRNCLEIAEEKTLLYRLAKEQINLAKLKVWEARRAFLPSVSLSWTKTGGKRGDKVHGIEYGIEGKQPAFHSGELIHSMAQSRANLKIAEKNYDKVKLDLYFEVGEAYYNFAKAKKYREFMKGLHERAKSLYRMAQDKQKNKLSSDMEFLNADSKFSKIYYQSVAADNDFDLARLDLEQKLNMKDMGVIDIETNVERKVVDKDIDACLTLAMENRPDLKMSEFTVKSTEYGKKIAAARGLPQVDLTGYYKKASEVTEPQGLDPHKKWYAGLEATLPLLGSTGTYSVFKKEDPTTITSYYGGSMAKGTTFKFGVLDNLKQFSEQEEAEIAYVRAEEELNEARKKVIMEVKEAYYKYEKARVQLEASLAQKEFREKEIKILEVRHGLGEAELSDLFDSMNGLSEANDAYFEAEKDVNVSIAALNKAMGWQDYF